MSNSKNVKSRFQNNLYFLNLSTNFYRIIAFWRYITRLAFTGSTNKVLIEFCLKFSQISYILCGAKRTKAEPNSL